MQIRNSRAERKEAGLNLKEKNRQRQLYTELGLLDIKRYCYYNKQQECYETQLDDVLGISAYEHLETQNIARGGHGQHPDKAEVPQTTKNYERYEKKQTKRLKKRHNNLILSCTSPFLDSTSPFGIN